MVYGSRGARGGRGASRPPHRQTHEVVVHDAYDDRDHRGSLHGARICHEKLHNAQEEVHGAQKGDLCEVVRDDLRLEVPDMEGVLLQEGNDEVTYHDHVEAAPDDVAAAADGGAEGPDETRCEMVCDSLRHRGSCAGGPCLHDAWACCQIDHASFQHLRFPASSGLMSHQGSTVPLA